MERKKTLSGSGGLKSKAINTASEKFDAAGITCRSSASQVGAVMAKFDDAKRGIVKSIGFGGLLELPLITKVSRAFSLWLLGKTNWETDSIELRDGVKMHIVDEDIARIIGIPVSSRDVKGAALDKDGKKNFLDNNLKFLGDERSLLTQAAMFVQKDLPVELTKQYEDQFKVAFVIFIMGRFLAPTTDHYIGNSDFWGALSNPDDIDSFNWSGYVLGNIIDSARVIKFTYLRKEPVSSITGCPLLIQVFYLDNIDLGNLSMEHDYLPRIKVFDCTTLTKMIEADTSEVDGIQVYGCSPLRQPANSCYAFQKQNHHQKRSTPDISGKQNNNQTDLNVSTNILPSLDATICHQIGVITSNTPTPLNPGPSDFSAYLRNKYPEHLDSYLIDALKFHNARCIQHANKYKNSLTSAIIRENMLLADKCMQHYKSQNGIGTSAQKRNNVNDRRRAYEELLSGPESGNEGEETGRRSRHSKQFVTTTSSTPNSVDASATHRRENNSTTAAPCRLPIKGFPNHKNQTTPEHNVKMEAGTVTPPHLAAVKSELSVNFTTPDASSKMLPLSPQLTASIGSTAVPIACVELNHKLMNTTYTTQNYQKKKVKLGRFAKSHWVMSVDHPERDTTVTHSLFDWLSTTKSEELSSYWVVHEVPRCIKIQGSNFKKQFAGGHIIGYDIFDAAVRRIKQLDAQIYQTGIPLRWRHIFESDYAMHCFAKANPLENYAIREQFIGETVDYELHRCRMLMVPVLSNASWSCYVWDLREYFVYIIDPLAGNLDDDFIGIMHSSTIKLIEQYIKYSVDNFFIGWNLDFSEFVKKIVRLSDSPCNRSDSRFYTLFCMKNFDGTDKIQTTQATINKFKEYILYEIFGLKGNQGVRPSVYVEIIDD